MNGLLQGEIRLLCRKCNKYCEVVKNWRTRLEEIPGVSSVTSEGSEGVIGDEYALIF